MVVGVVFASPGSGSHGKPPVGVGDVDAPGCCRSGDAPCWPGTPDSDDSPDTDGEVADVVGVDE